MVIVNPKKSETGLRTISAGIAYALLLGIEAIGFPFLLLGYYCISYKVIPKRNYEGAQGYTLPFPNLMLWFQGPSSIVIVYMDLLG